MRFLLVSPAFSDSIGSIECFMIILSSSFVSSVCHSLHNTLQDSSPATDKNEIDAWNQWTKHVSIRFLFDDRCFENVKPGTWSEFIPLALQANWCIALFGHCDSLGIATVIFSVFDVQHHCTTPPYSWSSGRLPGWGFRTHWRSALQPS